MNIIKEKIEQVLKSEEDARQIIESGQKEADSILAQTADKIRQIEMELMKQAEETISREKMAMNEEASKMIREMETQIGKDILSIEQKGKRNLPSAVDYILNRILE
ncbi:hypothetical protein JW926_01145 [Candidatus Sumerlaeota bacterium]|nr:hypothetical protein [Candidatus Sumerlaeota bacterium]